MVQLVSAAGGGVALVIFKDAQYLGVPFEGSSGIPLGKSLLAAGKSYLYRLVDGSLIVSIALEIWVISARLLPSRALAVAPV